MIFQGTNKYPVKELILHTSATPTDWYKGKTAEDVVREIDRWHKGRGWNGIGYHRVFMPDGSMGLGRSIYAVGAGCSGKNKGVIHLCMIPVKTINVMGRFEDFYTSKQKESVLSYIREVNELNGSTVFVSGHNQYANKLCPGFRVNSKDWGGI